MIATDLHIHSRFSSDGEYDVGEIVDKCLEGGIQIFSITDHNCARANEKAVEITKNSEIEFISGIEIDCSFHSTDLHLLGYNIDWKSTDFVRLESDISKKVMESLSEMIHNIKQLGFAIDEQAVILAAGDNLPTGELIAEVMLSDEKYYSAPLLPYMKGGSRSDMPYINFYLDYFAQRKQAHVPIKYMSYEDAISLVRDNGGVPIVAHHGLNFKGREDTIKQLLDGGAAGFEVFNNYHDADQIAYYCSVAEHRDALITCGSDFHGHNKPLISVGKYKCNNLYDEYILDSVLQILHKNKF